MFYVYILKSIQHKRLYIGFTPDLRRRLTEHNAGNVRSTKAYTPYRLVYYEAYTSEDDARTREARLKDFGRAYGQLKLRLEGSLRGREKVREKS